ncbi:MAG: hypothetical protein IPK83_00070 [Planctomycetes bacterium]|nr:hypothetical protein [Planctomycetota bacterium]
MADKGGGVCIDLASSPTFVGCTVADNVANVLTGGIYSLGSSSPTTLVNCILWQNVDDASSVLDAQLSVDSGSAIVATYSCIADGTQSSTPYSGTGNIDLDPIFFEPAAHNYRLHRCSPALDAADSDPIPDDDENADDDAFTNELTPELDNKLRDIDLPIVDTGNGTPDFVDMGAYEKECFCDELGDMNGDTERDGLDIQPFVDCFLNQRSEQACHCECGDYVFPGGVGIEDVAEFVNCLLDKSETCGQPACEIEGLPRAGLSDCNSNGQTDETDIVTGYSADCNGNGIPDECDIASETSDDDDADGTPDECEPDCNSNGIPDDHDIATETSEDCNANDVPDECDFDCNDNDIPDDCEELEADCNENGIPDACEYDCDENGVPDDCDLDPLDPDGDEWVDPDCNENGWPDSCDIDEGPPFGSLDANENEIPDECEEEESLMGGGEGGGESMMSGGGSSGGESSSESQSSGGSSPSPQPSPFEGEGAGCDASYWPADYSVMSNEMYAAWEAFMLWCMQERWGPDSAYTGAEQLERLIEKKVEVGICEDELNEQ